MSWWQILIIIYVVGFPIAWRRFYKKVADGLSKQEKKDAVVWTGFMSIFYPIWRPLKWFLKRSADLH
jgi:hypothetical protein